MIIEVCIDQLDEDPRNPNILSEHNHAKLRNNVQELGHYTPLIIRPNPDHERRYFLIDGHQRKRVFESLGWEKVLCQVWNVTEQQARLALASLNRLRGTDIPVKRAELIASLTETLSPETLAELIPEDESQIRDLLSLLDLQFDEMDKALKADIAAEEKELPVPYTFLVPLKDKPTVDKAFQAFANGSPDRGEILVRICAAVLEHRP